jgi:hypothetical protein
MKVSQDGRDLSLAGPDPIEAMGSFASFSEFMALMNFEHDCQSALENDEEHEEK